MAKAKKDCAELENPPILLDDFCTRLVLLMQTDHNFEIIPIRVSNIGGKDHYVTGFSIVPDKSYIRLTTSIGEIEIDGTTDKKEDTSK